MFIPALVDSAAHRMSFPDCEINGDINSDEHFNGINVDPCFGRSLAYP